MSAGRGDFERTLGALLALDVGKIERQLFLLADFRHRPRQHLRALEMIGELDERGCRDDLDIGTGPGRFRAAGGGTDQAFAARIGADRGGQHARDRGDRAVEPELAQHGEAGERVMRNGADRRHQAERDRQIVVAAFLRHVGGREIDGDAARRQREAGSDQRRAHAFARLRDRLVGQTDDMKGGKAGRHLHLDIDRAGLDALERYGGNTLNHCRPPLLWRRLAEAEEKARTIRERSVIPKAGRRGLETWSPQSDCCRIRRWVATSPPGRQTIAEIDAPAVFVYGVIDLMFAS